MFTIWFLIWLCFDLSYAQQFYDQTPCSSDDANYPDTNHPGTRYTCNSFQPSCRTFMVYRACQRFQTISNISNLFSIDTDELLSLNNLSSALQTLQLGREVLVPINCSCPGQYYQANFSYIAHDSTPLSEIACGVFEGLLKSITLVEENPVKEHNPKVGYVLHVPLRCACPDNFTSSNGVKYLVTYPFIEGDDPTKLSKKFGIPQHDIEQANLLAPSATVYPNTTVLVPLKAKPVIHFDLPADSPPPTPGFLPTIPVRQTAKQSKRKKLYIAGSVVGFCLILVALLASGLYVTVLKRWKAELFQFSARRSSITSCSTPRSSQLSRATTRSSPVSCLSPDLLVGIKYSLSNFSTEDLRRATKDFSEDTKISAYVYMGMIENVQVMIKRMRFEDTRHLIDVHSKINHVNVMKLIGVCYGESDFSWSYVVFEFPASGCLRDCLSNPSSPLVWHRRTQIAIDIARALHYLHYCMVPPYTHTSVNSRNIFVTPNGRAKLTVFGTTPAAGSSKESGSTSSVGGWVAPEHLLNGLASEKVDIFAFGIVLLELISGRDDIDGKLSKESIDFLGGGVSEGGCFEQLRNFMDPCLKEDYPLAEALCLAVLARACVEDDPMHRPSMDDIMKVLARMV
ncbi:lysM domain receptor-like kinase 4 [Cornus florida]|uniref:lysM domain receptor-like kinase 4 n=1 Tax=Cornus florida TaxID=4283 RepID=UPI0028965B54|nr:lysM domain receptor-like kinase 4 [Cornus florida]